MAPAETMASSRSTASTGAMMAGPLDPSMAAASVAQVSGRTEKKGHFCVYSMKSPSLFMTPAKEMLQAFPSVPSICGSSQCPPYLSFLMDIFPSVSLSLLFLQADLFSLLYRTAG